MKRRTLPAIAFAACAGLLLVPAVPAAQAVYGTPSGTPYGPSTATPYGTYSSYGAPYAVPITVPGAPFTLEGIHADSLAVGAGQGIHTAERVFTLVEDGGFFRTDGVLSAVAADGTPTELLRTPGEAVGALSMRDGNLFFSRHAPQASDLATPKEGAASVLDVLAPDGTVHTIADLAAWEATHNPDAGVTYGFDVPAACLDEFGAGQPEGDLPPSYPGRDYSLPSATVVIPHVPAANVPADGLEGDGLVGTAVEGTDVFVADAGANAILRVDPAGTVTTVAVLPPSVLTITEQLAFNHDLPGCAVGHQLSSEARPSGLALGPDGWLYVATSPLVSASLGAYGLGALYRISPDTGEVALVADGLSYASGLAVDPLSGRVFVSEMFDGRVVVLDPATGAAPVTVAELDFPGALALAGNTLVVALPTGLVGIHLAESAL